MTGTLPAATQSTLDENIRRLLESMREAASGKDAVPAEDVHSWTAHLESLLPLLAETGSARKADDVTASYHSTVAETAHAEDPCQFPIIPDNGGPAVRKLIIKAPMSPKLLSNAAMCMYAVLQAVVAQLESETLSFYLPYYGSDCDFRLVCTLDKRMNQMHVGSTILRGTNSIEYACMQTGYLINIAPRTSLMLSSKQQAAPSRDANEKNPLVARMSCPVKSSLLSAPSGVISVVGKPAAPFDVEQENILFDASLIIGELLQRCSDSAALQKCFAQNNFRSSLPVPSVSSPAIPSRGSQLVYRTNEQSTSAVDAIRVVGKNGVEKIREGSPILSVFHHMDQMQKAWTSAVKLNIELKAALDAG